MMQPLPYQREAIDWLVRERRGLLAFDPGLGKTFTALTAVHEMGCKAVLVVAPASVCSVWKDEMGRTYGHRLTLARGKAAERVDAYSRAHAQADGVPHYVVISYEAARTDAAILRRVEWDAIILDETLKIQNPTAKVTKAILSLEAPVRIALNGTPLSNGYADLWGVCTWLEPESLYGNFYKFRRIHAVMNPYYPAIEGWRDVDGIRLRTRPLMAVRKKAEELPGLPSITEQAIRFPLSPGEAALYRRIKKELRLAIKGEEIPIPNALVLLIRLRQVAGGVLPPGEGGLEGGAAGSKLEALGELLSQIPPGEKCVVFSAFKETARAVLEMFPGEAEAITGDVPTETRDEIVRRFQEGVHPRFLVGTDAMSVGLNLQRASYLINVDLPWSYARYDQRRSRCWRMGQTKPVTVWNLEAEGTVDARVRAVLERKVADADEFAGVTREDIEQALT